MTTRRLAPSRTIIASFEAGHSQRQHESQPPLNEYDEGLYILHVASGPCGSAIPSASAAPISCALSNQSVQTYDSATHALAHGIPRAHSGPITDLCHLSNEGSVVVTSGQDGFVRLFDLRQSDANKDTKGLSKAVAEMQLPRKEEALSVADQQSQANVCTSTSFHFLSGVRTVRSMHSLDGTRPLALSQARLLVNDFVYEIANRLRIVYRRQFS